MAIKIAYGEDSGMGMRKSGEYIDESNLGRYATELKEHLKILTEYADILYDRALLVAGDVSNSEYKDMTYEIVNRGTLIRNIGAVLDSYKLFSPFDYEKE